MQFTSKQSKYLTLIVFYIYVIIIKCIHTFTYYFITLRVEFTVLLKIIVLEFGKNLPNII